MFRQFLVFATFILPQYVSAGSSHTVTIEVKKPEKVSVRAGDRDLKIVIPSTASHKLVIQEPYSQTELTQNEKATKRTFLESVELSQAKINQIPDENVKATLIFTIIQA